MVHGQEAAGSILPADHEADVEPPAEPAQPEMLPKFKSQVTGPHRPRWMLSFKVEEDHAHRPRRRLNSTLHNGLWKGLTEAEKRARMSQSDDADIKLARLLAHHLKNKVEYLNEPRYGRVPRVFSVGAPAAFLVVTVSRSAFQALKFYRLKKPRNERELAELIPLDPPTITFDGFELGRVYKASCQILNASPWSQRLRAFLPCSRTFRVHADQLQGVVLAPGKSVTFDVTFSPTTLKDNVHPVFLSSEMDSCHVTLMGTNPRPTVFLPPVLNLGCCLIDHSVATSFPVAALEAAAKFQITAESADSSYLQSLYSCQNILYVPPFLAYPRTFSLGINESTEVIVMFRPQCTEHTSQVITLLTEYGHRWSIVLEGRGTDVTVELNRIDRRSCRDQQVESGGLSFGKATVCCKDSTRELTVRSKSLAPLRFYWKVEPPGEQEPSEAPAFSAHPSFGVLEPDSEAMFRFTFCPSEIKLYRQRAVLYLDTRQAFSLSVNCWEQFQRAVRNADNLAASLFSSRGNLLACRAHGGHAAASSCEQAFCMSNVENGGGIVKGLEVELIGVGDPLDVEIYPPLLSFPEVLCQGQTYKRLVELRNNTVTEVSFTWKTSETPWAIARDLNCITVLPVSGKVGPLGKAAVDVTLRATKIGLFQETMFCLLKEAAGLQLPLLVEACVEGPRVAIVQPMLEFGLVEAGSTVSMELTLINSSVVDAPFKLLAVCDGGQEGTLEAENARGASEADQEVSFAPASGTVPRLSQLTIMVNLVGCSCGTKAYAIVCRVANGLSSTQYALLRAFVDSPKAYFIPCKIDLGITFLHRRLTRTVLLRNLTGLTTCFSWPACEADVVSDTSAMRVDVTPRQGQLAPYGSQEFCLKLTPLKVGEQEFISVCDVMGAATPIGVLFRTYISDFRCSYHVLSPAEIVKADCGQDPDAAAADPYLAITDLSKKLVDTSSIPPLDFGKRCQLGCVHWLRLVLQNHTDISGAVHVVLKRYGSSYPPPLSKEDYVVLSNITRRTLTFPAGDTSSVLKTKKKKVRPLIDLPDEIHDKYWCPSGHYMVSRRLEIEMQNILIKSGEGISLLVYPDCQGFLDSWGQQCLDVFLFSSLPGSYSDVLTCSVGGLSPVGIPIVAKTVGSPLFARCQYIEPRGYQHPKSNPSLVLKWGPVCVGNPARTRRFWVANVSTFPLEVKWDMKILMEDSAGRLLTTALQPEDDSCVRVRLLGDAQYGPVQVNFEVVDKAKVLFRERDNLVPAKQDCPFYVKPLKQVIPLQGNACFEVTFHASQAAQHSCILLGRTRIPLEDEQGAYKRPSRRVTFLESTQILASDSLRRKSSIVTFSDKEAPEVCGSELIKITTSAGALSEPVRASRKPLLEATRSLRTAQGLLLSTRPECKASLKKTSIQIAGATLLSETGGRRSSLRKASLAADKDSAEDGTLADDPNQDAFTPLRVCLEAPVSEPRLKLPVDDALEFFCYETRSIVLRNEYTHSLSFTATVGPPFYLVEVESGLLSSGDDSSSLQKADLESVSSEFLLPSEWSLRLSIKFHPEEEVMSQLRDARLSGDLVLSFFEQYTQTIQLQAKVQFPAVRVLSENIWFGAVVVNAIQTLYFSVINDGYFDTHWQVTAEELVEEEAPAPVEEKPLASKKLDAKKAAEPVPLEPSPAKEALPWDPFQVDVAGGLLRGRGAREYTKQVVTVVFRPPRAKIYRQVFRIAAVHGRGCSLVMEGQGILEKPPEPAEQPKKGK